MTIVLKSMRGVAAATVCLLAACVAVPTTNAAFRNAPSIVNTSSFTVARPTAEVRAVLSRFAQTCIDGKSYESTSLGAQSYSKTWDSFFARVETEAGVTSLVVKRDLRGLNMVYLDPAMKGPQYFILADIVPAGGDTRINIRSVKFTSAKVVRAIEGWAKGQSQSCPDLTRLGW